MTIAAAAQIVTFRLGDDLFAADINDVERVLRYSTPTPVPNVPTWVQGVIEYRSQVVPVIDLRIRFELKATPPGGMTRLMVLASDGEWIAAVVDQVLEVVPLGRSQLAPPPPLFKGLSAEFLRGILRRNDRLIIVLDVARMLATKERLAFDRAMLEAVELPPEPQRASTSETPGAAVQPPATDVGEDGAENVAENVAENGAENVADDLVIIRGSHDPATDALELLGTAEDAPLPDEAILRGPGLPATPEWGAPPSPRVPGPDADESDGGQSDG
jgi:purine-binding chemotaxis protein CheW